MHEFRDDAIYESESRKSNFAVPRLALLILASHRKFFQENPFSVMCCNWQQSAKNKQQNNSFTRKEWLCWCKNSAKYRFFIPFFSDWVTRLLSILL